MKTTHTPGPWRVYENGDGEIEILATTKDLEYMVAVVEKPCELANARLISAAPELFNAVLDLLDCPDLNLDELEPQTAAAIGGARSAISKAKGL